MKKSGKEFFLGKIVHSNGVFNYHLSQSSPGVMPLSDVIFKRNTLGIIIESSELFLDSRDIEKVRVRLLCSNGTGWLTMNTQENIQFEIL